MLLKFLIGYFLIGLVFTLIYGYVKEENRFHVLAAVLTGWPIFFFAMLGSGWNALLSQEPRE